MLTRLLYLLPFSYFWSTRLRHGSIGFHVLFEWLAAAMLIAALAPGAIWTPLATGLLAYVAFISLYEIGYIANDLIMAPREEAGRTRGPQGTPAAWIVVWMALRMVVFVAVTAALGRLGSHAWWSYFLALAVVFAFHNGLADKELKAGTFLWLSWFRFMAPVVFAVPSEHALGIGLACAMSYSAFRQFGYLDSKGLLQMPGRKRPQFRWVFFLWPLLGALALATLPGAKGLILLTGYFALVASVGVLASTLYQRTAQGRTH